MIPSKNLFSGALGKAQNIGGSKCFTTPHTIEVTPQYVIDTKVPDVASFVACSLDGRLWLYQRSRRLYVVALRFNKRTGKLEFAASTAISNQSFIARGLDWILTNKHMIILSDNEPYISILNLFSNDTGLEVKNNVHNCFSMLPSIGDYQLVENFLIRRTQNDSMLYPVVVIGNESAADSKNIIHQGIQFISHNGVLWARGYDRFGRVLLLPAAFDGEGNVTKFYLYIQKEYPTFGDSLYTQNLNIEIFDGHSFCIFRTSLSWEDAKLACEAKGGHLATAHSKEKADFLCNFGAGWLGATYEEVNLKGYWITGDIWDYTNWSTNTPDHFSKDVKYIYNDGAGWHDLESSDKRHYICEWDYELFNEWSTLTPTFLGDTLYAFLPQSYSHFCVASNSQSVYIPASKQWLNISDDKNSKAFFDLLHSQALLLDDNGANIFYGDKNIRFECNALKQWIAPAGNVDVISDNLIIASNDISSLVTHLDSGFFREKISANALPLTSSSYSGKKMAIDDSPQNSKRILKVNDLLSGEENPKNIQWENTFKSWEDIYKQFTKFSIVNVFKEEYSQILRTKPLTFYFKPTQFHYYFATKIMTDETFTGETTSSSIDGSVMEIRESRTYKISNVGDYGKDNDLIYIIGGRTYDNLFLNYINIGLMYINLDTGFPSKNDYSATLPNVTIKSYDFDGTMSYGLYGEGGIYPCHFYDEHISHSESFYESWYSRKIQIYDDDNSISARVDVKDYSHVENLKSLFGELSSSTSYYKKVADLPSSEWETINDSIACNFVLNRLQNQHLIFIEKNSGLNIGVDISQTLKQLGLPDDTSSNNVFNFYHPRDVISNSEREKFVLRTTHLCVVQNCFIIVRSEYDTNIFDFNASKGGMYIEMDLS